MPSKITPINQEQYDKWLTKCQKNGYTAVEHDMELYELPWRTKQAFIRFCIRCFHSLENFFTVGNQQPELVPKFENVPRIPKLDEEKSVEVL